MLAFCILKTLNIRKIVKGLPGAWGEDATVVQAVNGNFLAGRLDVGKLRGYNRG